jgi:DNA-binding CsgD family transcriptional regulator
MGSANFGVRAYRNDAECYAVQLPLCCRLSLDYLLILILYEVYGVDTQRQIAQMRYAPPHLPTRDSDNGRGITMTVSNEVFNALVLDLYRGVREAAFTEFQNYALGIMKPILQFDVAIWGMGVSSGNGALISSVHLHNLPPQMMDEYAGEVQSQDPAAQRTTAQPGRTICIRWDDPEIASERRAAVRAYLHKYGFAHTLCTASFEPALGLNHFLTLSRSDPARPWTEAFRQLKERLFPHLIEAYLQARFRHMEPREGKERGYAIADDTLQLMNITPAFKKLMLREWPNWVDWRLPPELCKTRSDGARTYKGKHVIVAMEQDQQLLHVTVRTRNILDILTARELVVARLFARGLMSKDIAREIGISPHTVRNQLKSIYLKLGVGNKTLLADRLRDLS